MRVHPADARSRRQAFLLLLMAPMLGLLSCTSLPIRSGSSPRPEAARVDRGEGGEKKADAPVLTASAWDPRPSERNEAEAEEPDSDAVDSGEDKDAGAGDRAFDEETVAAEEVPLEEEDVEPSDAPVEELDEVDPELTPAEIQHERRLVELEAPEFDIPMSLNEKVLAFVDFYTNRHRDTFLPGLIRSGRYLSMIRKVFEEEGIPKDLAYMAHVESAYKPSAYSRAHARGIFQFIPSTGRRYGLHQDSWIDERSDPEKATRAAAAYLKDLHAMFGDWYLAMAAYNAGEGRISRAIANTGARDFWALALTSEIRTETKNYVPAILAATLISKDPSKYGFEFEPDQPLAYETIGVDGAVDLKVLSKCAGTDLEMLKTLNPALRRLQTPPHRRTEVRVPAGLGEATLVALAQVPASQRVLVAAQRVHRVRRGETLSMLARRYGTSVSALQRANRMGRRTVLRVGQSLRVPGGPGSTAELANARPQSSTRAAKVTKKTSGAIVYRVRRGDTLTALASRYRTSVPAIAAANGFGGKRSLRTGERIKIVPGARSASRSSGTVHTVRNGDTLWAIASRYKMSVDVLCALNNISARSPLHPGTRLTVRQ